MHRKDFLRLAGADQQAVEYLPVALLLRSGYGVAGYYNTALNIGLDDIVVLMNATLIDLNNRGDESGPVLNDFNDFLEEVVIQYYKVGESAESVVSGEFGKSIPLAAIPLHEVSVFYPVAQIGKVMHFLKNLSATSAAAPSNHAMMSVPSTPLRPVADAPGTGAHASASHSIAGAVNQTSGTSTLLTGVIEPDLVRPQSPPRLKSPVGASAARGPGSNPIIPIVPGTVTGKTVESPVPAKADESGAAHAPTDEEATPSFLDFNNKSIVLAALRTKIW